MAKRRRRRFSPRRFSRRFRRPRKVPLETLIAGVSIPFVPDSSAGVTPFSRIQAGDFMGAARSLSNGFIGMKSDGSIDLAGLVNPLNMESGRYTKMLIYSYLVGMVRKRVAKGSSDLFKKIPLIGRIVS